jgi:hypothetical protein
MEALRDSELEVLPEGGKDYDNCCRLIHTWETWKKSSIHSVCPWGQVRVKVLSPNPQLLRLGQLLAKPRGVVPNKNTKAFKLSTKLKSRSLLFFQTINHKLNKT